MYKGTKFTATQTLDITMHFKPTNTFQYVHGKSCHPPSTYKSIAKGECIRFLRTNSDPENYNKIVTKHKQNLHHRHFPHKVIESLDIPFSERPHTLENKQKERL